MSDEKYTIIVSGERLVFTRDQILSEPGNYFATFFLGDFAEGARGVREITVEKDIHLFKLIQAHLRGYVVLPLAEAAIPPCMTREVALVNLLSESQYYGLERLEESIKRFQPDLGTQISGQPPQGSPTRKYKFAMFNAGEWVVNDITQEGYQLIIARIANHPEKKLSVNQRLICPGYTQVVSWKDTPGEGSSALLISDAPAWAPCYAWLRRNGA